jgi:hypothetical protein
MKLDGDVLPALDERMTNWIDLGVKLKENWDGQSINIVNASNGSIIYISKDIFQFSEHMMIHFKMIMVNALMHHQRGIIITFSDQIIIPGMEYQIVKQLLLRQGVIVPNSEIATKLSNYELLTDSEAEVLRRAELTALLHIMWMR